jgi:16S rRNA (guanine527-N7)-methyltransferase
VTKSGGQLLDRSRLLAGASALGVPLTEPQMLAFDLFAAELVAWNRALNLTRLTSPAELALGHFADSLACLLALPPHLQDRARPASCVDVGSGAGLPGIALAIVRPMWRVWLIEATQKKAAFLRHVASVLDLEGVTVLADRAEEVGRQPEHRQAHDLAVARAVASMPVLAEYALPLLALGGRLVALKGRQGRLEAASERGERALHVLGGRLAGVVDYALPGLPGERQVVAVDKVRPTPDRYPRRPGVPSKSPL